MLLVARSNDMSTFTCPFNPSLPSKGPYLKSDLGKSPYPSLLCFLFEALPDKSFCPSTVCSPSSLIAFCHILFIKNSLIVYKSGIDGLGLS